MSDSQRSKSRFSQSPSGKTDNECTRCHNKYIAAQGAPCPYCGGHIIKSTGEDILRKTFDEPDLKKGGW